MLNLPTLRDLKKIAVDSIKRDAVSGEGKIEISEASLANLELRLEHCEARSGQDLWGSNETTVRLTQVAVTAAISVASDAVMRGGDDQSFLLCLVDWLSIQNSHVFDSDNCEIFLRLSWSDLEGFTTDEELEYVRGWMEQSLLPDSDLLDGQPLVAMVTTPISGLGGKELTDLRAVCVDVKSALERAGFGRVEMPLDYTDPVAFPTSAYDATLVRRLDLGALAKSVLVVVLLNRPSTGLGTIAAWANRLGCRVLILIPEGPGERSLMSPLPAGGPHTTVVGVEWPPTGAHLDSLLAAMRDDALRRARSREQRRQRLGGELGSLREALVSNSTVGRPTCSDSLPQMRVLEILRSVDFLASATYEEVSELQTLAGVSMSPVEPPELTQESALTRDQFDEVREFCRSRSLGPRTLLGLIELHLDAVELDDSSVLFQSTGHRYWEALLRRLRSNP